MLMAPFLFLLGCQKSENFDTESISLDSRSVEKVIFEDLVITDCCIEVKVRTNRFDPLPDFPMHAIGVLKPNGSILDRVVSPPSSQWGFDPASNPDFPMYWTLSYCFEEPGSYCLGQGDLIGVVADIVITPICFDITADCGPECVHYLSWDEFAGCWDVITHIHITINGMIQTIQLNGLNGFPPSGNYQNIFNNIGQELSIRGILATMEQNMPDIVDCTKGGLSPIPGFFFVGGDITEIKISGTGGSGACGGDITFHSVNCD